MSMEILKVLVNLFLLELNGRAYNLKVKLLLNFS